MIQMMKSFLRLFLSKEYIEKMIYAKMYFLSLRFMGKRFKCPICNGNFRSFLSVGIAQRENAKCPRCGSLERHRLIWMYLRNKTNFFCSRLKVLHFAPEYCFQRKFKSLSNLDYISADLYAPSAMLKIDITDIKLEDNTFDCILCSHVLEHISDDRKAMRELYRILKPNGWAILQVPIMREKTFEDISIKSAEERLKYFGNRDHVRVYGLDYKERLEDAGFTVKIDSFLSELNEKIISLFKLVPDGEQQGEIYLCSKID